MKISDRTGRVITDLPEPDNGVLQASIDAQKQAQERMRQHLMNGSSVVVCERPVESERIRGLPVRIQMKTKRAYTGWVSSFRDIAKRGNISVTDAYRLLISEPEGETQHAREQAQKLAYHAALVDRAIERGQATHFYFQSAAFCDWLITCVDKLEIRHAQALQELVGDNAAVVLHFPTSSEYHSVACACGGDVRKADLDPARAYSVLVLVNSGKSALSTTRNLDDGWDPPANSPPAVLEFERYAKLFCGLGMYFTCFPEMRKAGLPDDLKHPAQHQYGKTAHVGISPKVALGGTHDSPTPHFRAGHFRFLKSEKYTKKRFQTVFVHECFVKGRAETVLEPGQEVQAAA